MKKALKEVLPKAVLFFLILTLLCGGVYTIIVTGVAQGFFGRQANGSIIEIDGKKYGSELLGQQYTDPAHMWGRIMNIDTGTYTDDQGNPVMYAAPSNLSPASPEYEALAAERVEVIREAHPEKGEEPIPADLVTCSGSGLDPHISIAAAEYQKARLARENGLPEEEVQRIIDACAKGRFLGLFGEPVVNVLKVNLALDGIGRD